MKKEFIIVGAVILLGILYLAFRPDGKVRYKLPSWKAPERGDITDIYYGDDEAHHLRKSGDQWVMGDPERPVMASKEDKLMTGIEELAVTDLVSRAGLYENYQLEEGKAVKVRIATEKGEQVFLFGKKASTGHGTYGMFPGDDKVYLLTGDWNSLLPEKPGDLRDKTVLSFDADSLTEIRLSHGEKDILLTRGDSGWMEGDTPFGKSEELGSKIRTLSSLSCREYLPDFLTTLSPEWKIEMKSGEETMTLSVFLKDDEGYICKSSRGEDFFRLSEYQMKDILDFME